jgi:hypothetical protein
MSTAFETGATESDLAVAGPGGLAAADAGAVERPGGIAAADAGAVESGAVQPGAVDPGTVDPGAATPESYATLAATPDPVEGADVDGRDARGAEPD